MAELLKVEHLSVSFFSQKGEVRALQDVSFTLKQGEVLAIVGESGCGKTVLCKTILKLLPAHAKINTGSICVNGTDITNYREQQMRQLRGMVFSIVFQNPMTALHPSMTVGAQIAEAVKVHQPDIQKPQLQRRVTELMQMTGIDHPKQRMRQYPYQFSGGMLQRAVLASALACNPSILLADEPTTALDAVIQAQILALFTDIQKKLGMAAVFVTHDLKAAAKVADRVAVMSQGRIVETGTVKDIYERLRLPYTCGLLQASFTTKDMRRQRVKMKEKESKEVPEKVLAKESENKSDKELLLDIQNLSHEFPLAKNKTLKAIDHLSFQIYKGEIFGLVGESGSGKSTTARCVMNLCRPEEGSIFFKGMDTCDKRVYRKNRRYLQQKRQIIFQDSASSLDPRMKVCDLITEPMKIQHLAPKSGSMRTEAALLMRAAGLAQDYLDRYPAELSGGQRQRVAIARALSTEPELLVADEPLVSLDVQVQARIADLFRQLKDERGFSLLLIAHDLALVEALCDRIGVMYQGRLVECASAEELFEHPKHPYTKQLLGAAMK